MVATLTVDAKGGKTRYRLRVTVADGHASLEDVCACPNYKSGSRDSVMCEKGLALSAADQATLLAEITNEVVRVAEEKGAKLKSDKYELEAWMAKGHADLEATVYARPMASFAADDPVPAYDARIEASWTLSGAMKAAIKAACAAKIS